MFVYSWSLTLSLSLSGFLTSEFFFAVSNSESLCLSNSAKKANGDKSDEDDADDEDDDDFDADDGEADLSLPENEFKFKGKK